VDNQYNNKSLSLIAFRGFVEFGDILFSIIVQVQIYNILSTGLNLSMLMLLRNLPIIVIGVFAGSVVDSVKKSDLLIFCLILMSVFVLLAGFNVSHIFLLFIMFLYRIVYAFYKPVRSAILPTILQKEEILKCISTIMIVQEIATIIASLLVAKYFGDFVGVLTISAVVCFVIAVIIVFFKLRPLEQQINTDKKGNEAYLKSFFTDTKEGWIYLWHSKQLKMLAIIVALVWLAIGGFSSIQIIFLSQTLMLPSHYVGLSESVISVGNIIGYFIVTVIARRNLSKNYLTEKLWIGYAVAAVAMLVTSFTETFILYGLLLILSAVGDGFSNSIEESLEQKLPCKEHVGKCISIISSIGTIGYLFGVVLFPILTDYIDVSHIVRLCSICMFITSIVVFRNKEMMI